MSFKKFIMSSKVIKIGIISVAAMGVSAAPITILAKKNNDKSTQLKTIKKKNDDKIKNHNIELKTTQAEVKKLTNENKKLTNENKKLTNEKKALRVWVDQEIKKIKKLYIKKRNKPHLHANAKRSFIRDLRKKMGLVL